MALHLASLAQMTPQARVRALLAQPEDQWFDRKGPRISPRTLAETLVAFANAEGGTVVIGIEDGQAVDAAGNSRAVNGWRQAAYDFVRPPARVTVRTLGWGDGGDRRGDAVVIEVPPSDVVHATTKDEVYLRVGDENRRLTFAQRRELLFDKGQAQYDSTSDHLWDADLLDVDAVEHYRSSLGASDAQRLLIARGLLTAAKRPTVAGLLMFGRNPGERLPSAYLRVLRYRGRERGTGARLQVVFDERAEGSIPMQVHQAAQIVETLVPGRQALRPDGRFGAVPLIPRDAWLEGLVNAAVHRSYSNFGDHTRVEVFDDRLEIESPGRFPGLADVSDPLAITRFARNPRIARASAELGLGREIGEGIRRMFDEMRLAGLADPVYVQTAGSVRVILPTDPAERALEARLPEGARAVARLLRDGGRLGTGELVEATGRSRPWVLTQLRALQSAGIVERVGKSLQDPRAYWVLTVD